jgi:glycerol-3-phosphate acyltransferase PlsY
MPDLSTAPLILALWAVIGYLLGSVPFGIVMARLFGLGDLRQIGSGNIGATNVLRTGNKFAALLTLIFDAGKAGIAVLLARALAAEDAAQLTGFAAFFGHCFPVFLGFRGGKGVATYFGLMFALAWPIGLAAGATWLLTAGITRYSSLSALITAALAPVWMALLDQTGLIVLGLALGGLIFLRHRENITRLRTGHESKIGK